MNLSQSNLKSPNRLKNLIASQASNHFTCGKAYETKQPVIKRQPSITEQIILDILKGWKTLLIIIITAIIARNF